MTSPIPKLTELGQSLWYDNIERRLLVNGEIAAMIARGDIRGMTSNPAIFNNAIAKSKDYDSGLIPMAWAGYTPVQIYEQLAIEDIRAAADLFAPLYQATNKADGYVSLEVSPTLAYDTEGTLADAKRLWETVNRPNLMIKIPATRQGLPAIQKAIAAGINVNVTLIFSVVRYNEVMEAFIAGLEERAAAQQPLDHIASVASFFVSRIDARVDKQLDGLSSQHPQAASLKGKLAIANAKLAYQAFRQIFESARFEKLKAKGARLQRPLWASTSTKNPAYPDTIYVDTLIGAHTVNTAPPQTVLAFKDHGTARLTLEEGLEDARQTITAIEALGISVDVVTRELEEEGVKAFIEAFNALLKAVDNRRQAAARQLGELAVPVSSRVQRMAAENLSARIHAEDASVWTNDPQAQAEIRSRLGWLTAPAPEKSQPILESAGALTTQLLKEGYTHALVLGMGGSSLAPEVMSFVLDAPAEGLSLSILDSTDPAQVRAAAQRSPVEKTLYIVSSKSGSTAEINAFFDYFWARARRTAGDKAGQHFIAITDPDTSLEKLARQRAFRSVFYGDPAVGGRYSAFTAFGLVPAVLMGADAQRLLQRARQMMAQCGAHVPPGGNPALLLGAVLGEAALAGHDKLTLIADTRFASFGSWLEQLVAESSGKQGKGIVPVDGEALLPAEQYGSDRLFVYLRHDGRFDNQVAHLQKIGQPVLVYDLPDVYDLGAEFYRWEFATAVACALLGVNAFDQPDVQDAKTRTLAKINTFHRSGTLAEAEPAWKKGELSAYPSGFSLKANANLKEVLTALLDAAKPAEYIAINAYLPRNPRLNAQLRRLRQAIQNKTLLATTLGFGPRFLHSTGQLHKGGKDNGVFLQITAQPAADLDIPTQGMSFGTLERAQALGDYEALQARQRRILRIQLASLTALEELIAAL